MSSFKLEGDDAPEPKGESPTPPKDAKAADEFSYFLEDDGAPKPPPPVAAKPVGIIPPAVPVSPTPLTPGPTPAKGAPAGPMPARPVGATPVNPTGTAPAVPPSARPRPTAPPSNTNAVNALPDLMRPAQRPSAGAPADPSQPAGLNVGAAQAVTPVITQPDASSISQSAVPSDDLSSGMQEFGARFARLLDSGEDIFTWVARVAVLVTGLSMAVLLAGIFLGGAANIATNPKGADLQHFLMLATQGFTLGTLALAVSFLLLTYDDNRLGAMVAGVGLLFHFVVPLGLRAVLGAANPAYAPMATQFLSVGRLILAVGMFKAFIDIVLWVWNLPNQMRAKQNSVGAVGFGNPVDSKQQRIARQANMFSPCWKLPFCRDPIRVLCPAFLAKTTCWKFGRGCYCDTEMVGRIVRNEPLEIIKAATTAQSKQPPPCARCYIFLEHQTHKFRMCSPLVLPSTIAIMFAVWPIYNRLFLGFTSGYMKLFSSMSFSTDRFTPDAIKSTAASQAEAAASGALTPEAIAQVSSYMLGALLGFFLLIYMSKFVEWAIFKAKW